MMSSRPDISAPLSRKKTQPKGGIIIGDKIVPLTIAVFIIVFLCVAISRGGTTSSSSANSNDTDSDKNNSLRSLSNSKQQQQQQQQQEQKQHLLLTTPHGNIRIKLRPDLSPESVQHVRDLAADGGLCQRCKFYRSEKALLLQGIMKNSSLPHRPTKGLCPPQYYYVTAETKQQQQDCPDHDPNCGCHGPTMTKGMVGWAGGGIGPDFFINVFPNGPVDWWEQQHTVWGSIEEEASLDLIENHILAMPVKNEGGMHMLEEPFEFQIALV